MADQPSMQEMKEIVRQAERCLECDAPECHETTPEGVDVCAELTFFNGRPITRTTLLEWSDRVRAQSSGVN